MDRTNYYETLNATDENLEFALGLEADRMVNSPNQGRGPGHRVLGGPQRVRGWSRTRPSIVLKQRMMAVAYEWHNYGKSTIGNRSDIERVPVESLRAFYRKYYQPDNAVLVVAGKFDAKKALELIRKILRPPAEADPQARGGPTPRSRRRTASGRSRSAASATCRSVGAALPRPRRHHAESPRWKSWPTSSISAPSGRLYKALVETKKAASVSSNAGGYHDPGIIEIAAEVHQGPVARRGPRRGLEDRRGDQGQSAHQGGSRSVQGPHSQEPRADRRRPNRLAVELGEWAAQGDWRLYFLHRDRIEKVTTEQIKEAAEKYFRTSNRTIGFFIPTDRPDRTPIPVVPEIAGLVDGYEGRDSSGPGEAFDAAPWPSSGV